MKNTNRVIVIAAHPDDELLGCGGTIAQHIINGDEVCSIIMCEGSSVRGHNQSTGEKHYAQLAANILGVQQLEMLNFPDQQLDTFTLTKVITPLEKIIHSFKPNIIYSQFGGDINRDHQLLFEAMLVATRPTLPFIQSIYAFDTASSTEWAYPRSFIPDTWVDIEETLDIKLKAMSCYKSELCEYPHPRSIQGLKNRAHAWGNQACMNTAEVFMTIRRSLRDGQTPI